jgi:hypothetical protein
MDESGVLDASFLKSLKKEKRKRKVFSEVQKRVLAEDQGYKFFGELCMGKVYLPST